MIDPATLRKMRALMEARVKRDETKQAAKTAENEYRELEAEVWDMLEESPLKKPYNFDLGEPWGMVRFSNNETYYGRIIDAEAALRYFQEHNMADAITEPKVVGQRLNEVVREALENDGVEMPDGCDFTARRYIQITRQKSS